MLTSGGLALNEVNPTTRTFAAQREHFPQLAAARSCRSTIGCESRRECRSIAAICGDQRIANAQARHAILKIRLSGQSGIINFEVCGTGMMAPSSCAKSA
jgi:hypothetical protein